MSRPVPRTGELIGRSIGNYLVEKRLGAGGMGAVYRLKHRELPNTYQALKVLLGGSSIDQAARERFRQEALVAATVGSHRVAKPLDLGHLEDGTPYIVMEYVPGRSLEEELRVRGALPVEEALRIGARVAETMALAHDAAIVHRDLKPANIMLIAEGGGDTAVKILDFGIARSEGEIKVARTVEGVVMGTPGYWSPEAVAGRVADGRADVFALGVILFEMLTGELPFRANTAEAAMLSVLTDEVAPSPSSRRPRDRDRIPAVVDALVARALVKDRARRLAMIDAQRALGEALREVGGEHPRSVGLPILPEPSKAPTLADGEPIRLLPPEALRAPPATEPAMAGAERTDSPTHLTLPPSQRSRRALAALVVAGGLALAGAVLLTARTGIDRQGAAAPEAEHSSAQVQIRPPPLVPDASAQPATAPDAGSSSDPPPGAEQPRAERIHTPPRRRQHRKSGSAIDLPAKGF